MVGQRLHALAGARRHREVLDVGEVAQRVDGRLGLGEALQDLGAVGPVDLVDHDHQAGHGLGRRPRRRHRRRRHRRASPASARLRGRRAGTLHLARRALEHGAVPRADLRRGVDDRQDHVDVVQGVRGRLVQPVPERGPGPVDPRRVDEDHLRVGLGVVEHAEDAVPRGVGPRRGDRHLRPHHLRSPGWTCPRWDGRPRPRSPSASGSVPVVVGAARPLAVGRRRVGAGVGARRLDPDPADAPARARPPRSGGTRRPRPSRRRRAPARRGPA